MALFALLFIRWDRNLRAPPHSVVCSRSVRRHGQEAVNVTFVGAEDSMEAFRFLSASIVGYAF